MLNTSNDAAVAMPQDHGKPQLYLGVDAGGTKTRALVATVGAGGKLCIEGVGHGGPGNPLSSGAEAAAESIAAAVDSATRGVVGRVYGAVVAAAGTAHEEPRAALRAILDSRLSLESFDLVPDYAPLFFAAPEGPVVATIVGTGSVVFVRDSEGVISRCGGWGYLLGDEGSGYQIGRDALRLAIEAHDQGKPESPLCRAVTQALGCEAPGDLLTAVYSSDDARSLVASIARVVSSYVSEEEEAAAIIDGNAEHLAEVISMALSASDVNAADCDLVLTGGIVAGAGRYVTTLAKRLAARGAGFRSTTLVRDPAEYCLLAACFKSA